MDVLAKLTRHNQTPRKTRLVTDLVCGKKVDQALDQLSFVNKRASLAIKKLINTAVANARHNFNLNFDDLFIKEVRVDKGVVYKRAMPRAFGLSSPIRKRTSNITLILSSEKAGDKTSGKNGKDKKNVKQR